MPGTSLCPKVARKVLITSCHALFISCTFVAVSLHLSLCRYLGQAARELLSLTQVPMTIVGSERYPLEENDDNHKEFSPVP